MVWRPVETGGVSAASTHEQVGGWRSGLANGFAQLFWFGGSNFQLPDYENVDIFVERLVREGLLLRDPVVEAAVQGQIKDLTERAVQYRFLRTTGITQNIALQIERARSATILLQQGVSILDTIEQAGYYDQPHLTRSLTRFIGQTPAQLLQHSRPEQLSFLYKTTLFP